MTTPTIPECPDVDELVTTDSAVHLIVRVRGEWEVAREDTVAEVERRTLATTAFAQSAAFRARFGERIGVVRVQSATAAPSIVVHLLAEKGFELEDLSAARPADGQTCAFCKRERLTTE